MNVRTALSGKYFSMSVPDVVVAVDGACVAITVETSGDGQSWSKDYSETLYPVGGVVTLGDLGDLLTPMCRDLLWQMVRITLTEQDSSAADLATETMEFTAIYCLADIDATCDDFLKYRFLSLMDGDRLTAVGRAETLCYMGSESARCEAEYADGTTATITLDREAMSSEVSRVDTSAGQFTAEGKTLVAYTIYAGYRHQRYLIDFGDREASPVLVFENSLGVDELLYCFGTLTASPSYKRDQAYILGRRRSYKITETRTMKADTGPLSEAQAWWALDALRSPLVRLATVEGGKLTVGREIVVDDQKTEWTNDDDELPRLTLSYTLAQRNHNVPEGMKVGRIFDSTFDASFI